MKNVNFLNLVKLNNFLLKINKPDYIITDKNVYIITNIFLTELEHNNLIELIPNAYNLFQVKNIEGLDIFYNNTIDESEIIFVSDRNIFNKEDNSLINHYENVKKSIKNFNNEYQNIDNNNRINSIDKYLETINELKLNRNICVDDNKITFNIPDNIVQILDKPKLYTKDFDVKLPLISNSKSTVKHMFNSDFVLNYNVVLECGLNLNTLNDWNINRKSNLINAILMGTDIGAISIINNETEKIYSFVNGGKRIQTIQQFINNEFPITFKGRTYFYAEIGEQLRSSIDSYQLNLYVMECSDEPKDSVKIDWFKKTNYNTDDVKRIEDISVFANNYKYPTDTKHSELIEYFDNKFIKCFYKEFSYDLTTRPKEQFDVIQNVNYRLELIKQIVKATSNLDNIDFTINFMSTQHSTKNASISEILTFSNKSGLDFKFRIHYIEISNQTLITAFIEKI